LRNRRHGRLEAVGLPEIVDAEDRDALWHPQSAPAARHDIEAIAERLNRSIRGRAGFDDATRRVPFKTFQAVEFETPALRATSAIVATLLSQCMDFVS
jgi:hypothetical protein